MTDEHIVDRVLNGDTQSFEILILKYQQALFATSINIVKEAETAKDISQEAFMKAYENLASLRNKEQFYPWLKRIAINLSLISFERGKRKVNISEDEDENDNFFENISDFSNPEKELINEELKRYVRKFVDALPAKLRTVIVLREVEEYSYEEISEMLKIPVGTVRSRLFNARQFIKQRLVKQGLADGMYKVS